MAMDTARHVKEIQQQGYSIIQNVLNPSEIKRMKDALAPYLTGHLMGRNNFEGHSSERVYALLAKDTAFSLIVEHPYILAVLDALLEPDYLLSANLAINTHPGETPQPYHRDNDGGKYGDRSKIHGISTIWNLDEFTGSNGATEIVPGSHIDRDIEPSEENSIQVTMPAGSVLVFTGSVFHRGGANESSATRLAITPQYCQPWLRQLENMVLSVPPEKAGCLSEKMQSMLGYSVMSQGFMGYVDGVHPKRLINKAYAGRKARGENTLGGDIFKY